MSDQIIALVDEELVIADANPAACLTLGVRPDELRRPFIELIHGDDRAAVLAAIDGLADGGRVDVVARCSVAPDDQERSVAWTFHREDGPGGGRSVCVFGRVLTPRERFNDDVEKLFVTSTDLMCVVDRNGFFSRVNPAFTTVLGWSEEELLNTPFMEFIHPDDIEPSLNAYADGMAGRKVVRFENRYRTMSGAYRWLQWAGGFDPGSGLGYAIARDVTEIRELQENLAAAESQAREASARIEETEHIYRQILDSLEDLVLVKREESRLYWGNKAFLEFYGMTQDELQGVIDKPHVEPDYTQQYVKDDLQVWESGKPLHIPEEPVTRYDGEILHFETVKTPIFDSQRNVKLTVGVSRDLTRRREAEELRRSKTQAEQAQRIAEAANRTKSMFLANMSHELRTPLNAVLGYAQVLAQDPELSARQRQSVEVIRRSGEHLLTMISDVLDLSRIEAGKLELAPREFYLAEFLEGIAEVCEVRAQQKRLVFTFRPLTALPVAVRADETRLRQVLLNLLINAIKFTDAGTVTLEVAYRDGALSCVVQDSGVGVPPERLGSIFEPFEQIRRGDAPLEGTGLGLPISNELVRMMGGELRVTSEIGRGSRFWFEIPVEETAGGTVSRTIPRPIAGYQGPRKRVLIIDDKRENRQALSLLLEGVGFEVLEAEDGSHGLCAAASDKPDIIFMDLVMPVLDGFEATRRIRANPATAHIPIVAVSASVFDDVNERSLAVGCNDFITKPFRAHRVFAVLAEQLGLTWRYLAPAEVGAGAPRDDDGGARPGADTAGRSGSAGSAAAVADAGAGSASGLPRDVLAQLHDAAGIGDVGAIITALAGYLTADGEAAQDSPGHRLAATLHGLARRFQLGRIEELTAQLLEES